MSQRAPFLFVGGAIGCVVVALCLCVGATAGYSYLSPLLSPTMVDRIAYVDNSNNIQVVDSSGEHRIALTADATGTDRVYLFPTWSPDSRRIAFVGVSGQSDSHEAVLYTAPAAGGNRSAVFTSATETPFYLYWAPDSQWIGFLAQGGNSMALMLGRGDGQVNARQLGTGSPFYWAWSPDSQRLFVHVGGSARDARDAHLALVQRDSTTASQALKSAPASFEAPQFSPDGAKLLFAGTDGSNGDSLFLADAQGDNTRAIVSYQGNIAFAWSPDGKRIASIVTPDGTGLPNYGPVWVSDADGGHRLKVTDDGAIAFYWSPGSDQVAFLTLAAPSQGQSRLSPSRTQGLSAPRRQTQSLVLRWQLVNVTTKNVSTLISFAPTGDFLSVLPYFDQYARSLTFWSPDGKHFVYTQDGGKGTGSVWVADVTGKAQPNHVGDGTLAAWSWR
jgi:Tol biopolymer transport system component